MVLRLENVLADQSAKADAKNTARTHLAKLLEFSFVVLLAGVTGLLEHVKDLSLVQQTVNTLPWEVAQHEDALIELLDRVPEEQLVKGKLSPTTFPLLCEIRSELITGAFHSKKLSLIEGIQVRSRRSPLEAFDYLCKYKLAKGCDVVYQRLKGRFVLEDSAERQSPTRRERVKAMEGSFSLVRLCQGQSSLEDLKAIKQWATEAAPHIPFAAYEQLGAQQQLLAERLQRAKLQEPYYLVPVETHAERR
ncbi:hypothetical protein CYMTET_3637 [Cymbomonas tetramitiformis]|uniref:Uncharacterized protein n=1 Tax=Cymbomonas tetramitiformis TaxID=36881 RepID=A0AAE0LLB6_9CHLO|nr:hypothetical protein CYMTET_3637 [Cymbomonas tetramitiformis]